MLFPAHRAAVQVPHSCHHPRLTAHHDCAQWPGEPLISCHDCCCSAQVLCQGVCGCNGYLLLLLLLCEIRLKFCWKV